MESFTCSKLVSCHGLLTIITLLYFCTIATTLCLAARLPEQRMIKSNTADFIKTSCGVTRYPDICYETLSSYARTIQTSPKELANAALSVSLKEAQSTCMDNFEGNGFNGEVKSTVRGYIIRVSQLTSNALALINQLR